MSDADPGRPRPQVHDDDREQAERRLDEEEIESFPASDPHSEWAGPEKAS